MATDAANLWPPLTPRKTRSVRAKARGVPSCPEQCLAESVHSVNTSRVVTWSQSPVSDTRGSETRPARMWERDREGTPSRRAHFPCPVELTQTAPD